MSSFALKLVCSDDETGMVEAKKTVDCNFSPQVILRAFSRALELAREVEGATAPNPPVGCVLLDAAGQELASGAHRQAGHHHAEVEAIMQARASGLGERIDTVVVTLEPCNHHGHTPPCVEAILNTGARQVWIACRDPNLQVTGGGAERLSAAGLSVHFLCALDDPSASPLLAKADRLLAPFSKRVTTGLPFITIKQAISAAGTMVPDKGQKTFTSPSSLELAHRLRRRADAILTGSGTILADNPLLTVRLVPDHPRKPRMLVILDRRRRVPHAYLHAAEQLGFALHLADDVHAALQLISDAGGLEVLVEAGATLTEHLLAAGLWDEHLMIRHSANTDGTDQVSVRHNPSPKIHAPRKENDVFGHH